MSTVPFLARLCVDSSTALLASPGEGPEVSVFVNGDGWSSARPSNRARASTRDPTASSAVRGTASDWNMRTCLLRLAVNSLLSVCNVSRARGARARARHPREGTAPGPSSPPYPDVRQMFPRALQAAVRRPRVVCSPSCYPLARALSASASAAHGDRSSTSPAPEDGSARFVTSARAAQGHAAGDSQLESAVRGVWPGVCGMNGRQLTSPTGRGGGSVRRPGAV